MTSPARPQLSIEGSTLAVTAAVVKALHAFKGQNPDQVGTVERHKGRFSTPQAVKEEVTNYGAIRVAALNVTDVRREAGSRIGRLSLVAFVMTTDHFGHHRDVRAEVIASRLAVMVSSTDWTKTMGKVAYKQAESVNAQNMCTDALDDIGVAIWSVSWSQECRLNVPVDLDGLDDFLTLQLDTPESLNPDNETPSLSATIDVRAATTEKEIQ